MKKLLMLAAAALLALPVMVSAQQKKSSSADQAYTDQKDGKEVFVHYSDILTDGFKNLAEGEAVTFKTVDNGKGLRAVEVQKAGQ